MRLARSINEVLAAAHLAGIWPQGQRTVSGHHVLAWRMEAINSGRLRHSFSGGGRHPFAQEQLSEAHDHQVTWEFNGNNTLPDSSDARFIGFNSSLQLPSSSHQPLPLDSLGSLGPLLERKRKHRDS